jgi:hypothetical protein
VLPELDSPAALSNVLRIAILFSEGGVYLDLDTVTIASLAWLRQEGGFFCGLERLAFPAGVKPLPNLPRFGLALGQAAVRSALSRLSDGWRWFRAIEPWYPAAANNAVLGSEPEHPFCARLLRAMAALSPGRRRVRYALGTRLLQAELAEGDHPGLRVLPPPVFYPLGPEISQHWFRVRPQARLSDVVGNRTRVVHWYASNRRRSKEQITPDFVRRHADRQWFSALALPFVD